MEPGPPRSGSHPHRNRKTPGPGEPFSRGSGRFPTPHPLIPTPGLSPPLVSGTHDSSYRLGLEGVRRLLPRTTPVTGDGPEGPRRMPARPPRVLQSGRLGSVLPRGPLDGLGGREVVPLRPESEGRHVTHVPRSGSRSPSNESRSTRGRRPSPHTQEGQRGHPDLPVLRLPNPRVNSSVKSVGPFYGLSLKIQSGALSHVVSGSP